MQSKASYSLVCILFLILQPVPAGAVSQTVKGDETGLFDADMLSVVVGKIIEVKADDPGPAPPVNFVVRMEPISTLAGHLDPSLHGELRLRLTASDATTMLAIHFVPHKGDLVMAVVLREDTIYRDATMFMPDGVPLVVLRGMGDKRVIETLNRIREARSHEQPRSPTIYEATGTTQPAPDPAAPSPAAGDKPKTPPAGNRR